jgi:lysophospholipase L1-like esterase
VLRSLAADDFHVWPPGFEQVLHPRPEYLPGVEGPSRFQANGLGVRGDELTAKHELRILALGGSTTECLYLDQEEAWPRLLEKELAAASSSPRGGAVWVGNAGKSGNNTRHHRLQAEVVLPRVPDLDAVVLLLGVNDLSRVLALDGSPDPAAPASPGGPGGGGGDPRLARQAFHVTPARLAEGSFFKRTALWQGLRRLMERGRENPLAQDPEGKVYDVWRRYRAETPTLRAELPDLDAALAEYAENVRRLARRAAERGARVVLVDQPALWREGLPADLERLLWMGGVGDFQAEPGHAYYSSGALAEGLAAYNRTLLAVCREIPGALCVDLAAELRRDTTIFYDDVHFNEAGSRRVARMLAERITSAL